MQCGENAPDLPASVLDYGGAITTIRVGSTRLRGRGETWQRCFGRGLGEVLGDLAGSAMTRNGIAYAPATSGAPHERDRVYMLPTPSAREGRDGHKRNFASWTVAAA